MVEEYKKARLVKVIEGKEVDLSPATVNRDISTLKRMYSLAEEWGHIESSQMRRVKKLKEDDPRTRFLTEAEEAALLAECRASSEELYLIALVALQTGMRKEAIVSLKWPQVDFKARMVSQAGKGGKVVRIPLTNALHDALKAYRDSQSVIYPYVFPGSGSEKRRLSHRNVEAHAPWDRAVLRAGLEDFRFHDLRHTFATNFYRRTKNWKALQEILGHADISTTMRIYCHLEDEDKKEAMREFEAHSNGK
jgi:integrase